MLVHAIHWYRMESSSKLSKQLTANHNYFSLLRDVLVSQNHHLFHKFRMASQVFFSTPFLFFNSRSFFSSLLLYYHSFFCFYVASSLYFCLCFWSLSIELLKTSKNLLLPVNTFSSGTNTWRIKSRGVHPGLRMVLNSISVSN